MLDLDSFVVAKRDVHSDIQEASGPELAKTHRTDPRCSSLDALDGS